MNKKIIAFFSFFLLVITSSLTFAYTDEELDAANSLADRDIINDHANDVENYNLDQNVLRQEISAVARGIAGLDEKNICDNIFSDVSITNPNSWACYSIEVLVDNNLISKNTHFRPEDKITKTEALGMIIKAKGFDYNYDPNNPKNWQEQIVEYSFNKQIIDNFTDYNTLATRGWIFTVAEKINNINFDNELNNLIISSSSYFGRFSGYNIFDDGKYIDINQFISLEDPVITRVSQCYEGKFSEDSFYELKDYIIKSGFFENEIKQEDSLNLVCEGNTSLNIRIGNKFNIISTPCVNSEDKNTENVTENLNNISKKIGNIKKENEKLCKIGQYIKLFNTNCNNTPENIVNSSYTNLDFILKKSYNNLGTYNYISDNELNENYNRKYYKIENKCYFSMIYNFDGTIFE